MIIYVYVVVQAFLFCMLAAAFNRKNEVLC